MIRKEEGELVVECNACEETQYGGTLEFRDFIADIKDNGWRIRKNDMDEWEHFCPECARYK